MMLTTSRLLPMIVLAMMLLRTPVRPPRPHRGIQLALAAAWTLALGAGVPLVAGAATANAARPAADAGLSQASAEGDGLVAVTSPVRTLGITPRPMVDDEVPGTAPSGRATHGRAGVNGAALGPRSVLVLRLYYTGEGWPATTDPRMDPYTPAEVQQRLTGVPFSASAMLSEQSGGMVSLAGTASSGVDISPWLIVSGAIPQSGGACNADAMRASAIARANAVDLSPDSYDHVLILIPYTAKCGWAGLGEVPGSITWINGFFGDGEAVVDGAVVAHELGHNLGVAHASSLACTQPGADPTTAVLTSPTCRLPTSATVATTAIPAEEYGDPFELMGSYGYSFTWRGTELMSTWHRAQLLQLAQANQQLATAAGTYELSAAGSDSGVQLLRIARPGASSSYAELAIEYRPARTIFDQWGLAGQSGGVLVRLVPSLTTTARSYLLDGTPETRQQYASPDGDQFRASWRDAALQTGRALLDEPTGLSVRVTAMTPTAATVALSGGVLTGGPAAPTPSPTLAPIPTSTPSPTPSPTPATSPAPGSSSIAPGSGSSAGPILPKVELLFPQLVGDRAQLTGTRRIIVRVRGAGRVQASIAGRWSRSADRGQATFKLPRWATQSSVVRLRATGGALAAPVVATVRIRRGVAELRTL